MAALKDQARLTRSRQIQLAAALALGLAAAWLFVGRPTSNAIARVSSETDTIRVQLNEDRARSEQLPTLRAEVRALSEQVKRFRSIAPRSELDAAFKEIGALCERSGVHGYQFTQESERREQSFVEQPCKLKFRGDFVAAATLVNRLETTDWLTRLRSLSVRRVDPVGSGSVTSTSGEVVVELTLNLYFAD